MNQQQQQQQGNGGGQGQNGIQNQNPNLMQNPNGASPLGMMQVINQNMQGVQRQYQALQSQPDSPQKEASINGLKAQMAKLTQMRAQATQMWETASRNNQMQQQQGGGGGQAGMNPNPNLQQQQYQMAQQLGQDSQSNPMRAASGGGMQMGMGMGMGNQNQPGMIQSQQNQSSRPPNSNSSNPNQLFEVIRSFHASKGTEDGGANLAPFSAPSSANPNQLAQVDVAKLFTIVVGTVGSYAILDSTEPWNPSPNSSENHSTTKGWAQLALKLGFAIANGNTDPNSQIGSDTPRKMSEYYKTKLGGFEKVWLERGGAGKMLNNGGPQHQRSDSSSSNPPMNPLNPAASFPPQMQQQLQQLQQAVKSGQISQDQAKKAFSEMSKAFMVKQQQQGSNPNQPQPQQNQNQNQENQSTDPNSSNANQESSSKEKENSKESTSATANPANGEKKDSGNNQEVKNEPEPAPEVPVKRGRGRPRKRPREDTANSTISTPQEEANEEENKKPKRETPSVNADGNGDEEKDRLATSTPVQLQNPSFATPQQFQQAPPIPPSRPNPDPLHPMLSQPIPGFNPPPNVSIEQTLQSMKQKYAVLFPQMSYAVGVLKNQSSSVSQTQKDTAQNLIRTTQYLANTIKALEQQLKAGAGSSSNSIPGGSAAQNPLSAISALLPPPHPSLSSLSPSIQVPQATSDPSTYSIAYIPTIRDVRTYAGIDINGLEGFDWDSNRERNLFALNEREDLNDEYVKRVESTLFGLDQRTGLPGSEGKVERVGSIIRGRGKVPRGINELGTVDISNLILSLRSRLEVEVTHTLNTLLILTSGVGAPRNFRFLLEPCEDLLDELLNVFIENSWREEEELIVDPLEPQSQDDDDAIAEKEASNNKSQQGEHSQKDAKTPEKKVQDWLYQDWLEAAEEDEGEMRIWKRFDRSIGNSNLGGSSSSISAHQGTSGTSRNANTSHVDGEAEPDNRNPNDKSTSTPPLSTSTSATSSSSDLNESNPSLPISTSEYFSSLNKERSLNRKAAMALVILNIFLNASFVEENMVFFSRHSRFWNVLTSLLEEGEQDVEKWEKVKRNSLIKQKEHSPEQKKIEESSTKPKTVFTTSEHLRIRKDILSILSNLSDPVIPLSQKPRSTNLTIWRLLKSFLLDDTRLEDPTSRNVYSSPNSQSSAIPAGAILPMTVTKAKVPYYSDLSFQAFSRLAQPDPNREVLSTLLTDKEVIEFSMTSLRRLPFDPSELMLLVSESWHAHCMRILLSIHSLIFLSNQNLKRKIRKSLNHVLPVTLTRLMRQLAAAYNNEFSQNNFRDLVIIIVEILKVVDQCTDTLGDVPSLLFGNQDIDEKEEKSKRNLPAILVGLEEEVKKILNITNLYPKIAYDLQQMLAF